MKIEHAKNEFDATILCYENMLQGSPIIIAMHQGEQEWFKIYKHASGRAYS